MSNYNNLVSSDAEKLTHCPYNKAHVVTFAKLAKHLDKCRRTYNGNDIKICKFNTTHHIKATEYNYHLQNCQDRIYIYNHQMRMKRRSEADPEDEIQPKRQKVIVDDEDWENCEKKTYNPQKHLENSNHITHVQHMTKSQREIVRLEREKKFLELELMQTQKKETDSSSEEIYNVGASTSKQSDINKNFEVQKSYQELSPTAFRDESDENNYQKSPQNFQMSTIDDDDIFGEHKKTRSRQESTSSSSVCILNNHSKSPSILTITSNSSQNLHNYERDSDSNISSNYNRNQFRDDRNDNPSKFYNNNERNDYRSQNYRNEDYERNYESPRSNRSSSVQNYNNFSLTKYFNRGVSQNYLNSNRNFDRNSQRNFHDNQRNFNRRGRGRFQNYESRNDFRGQKNHSRFDNNERDQHESSSYSRQDTYRQNHYRNYTKSPSTIDSRSRSRSISQNSADNINYRQELRKSLTPVSIVSNYQQLICLAGMETRERTGSMSSHETENLNESIKKSNEREEFRNEEKEIENNSNLIDNQNLNSCEILTTRNQQENVDNSKENEKLELNNNQTTNFENCETQNCNEDQNKRQYYSELFPSVYENLRASESENLQENTLFDPNIKIKVEKPDDYPESGSNCFSPHLNEAILENEMIPEAEIKKEVDYKPPESLMERLREIDRRLSESSVNSSSASYCTARQSIDTTNSESSNSQKKLLTHLEIKKEILTECESNLNDNERLSEENLNSENSTLNVSTENSNDQNLLNFQRNSSSLVLNNLENSARLQNEENFLKTSKENLKISENSQKPQKFVDFFEIILKLPKEIQETSKIQDSQMNIILEKFQNVSNLSNFSSENTSQNCKEQAASTSSNLSNNSLESLTKIQSSKDSPKIYIKVSENIQHNLPPVKVILNDFAIIQNKKNSVNSLEKNFKSSKTIILNDLQKSKEISNHRESTEITNSENSNFDQNVKIKTEKTEILSADDHPRFRTYSESSSKKSESSKTSEKSEKSSKSNKNERKSSNKRESRDSSPKSDKSSSETSQKSSKSKSQEKNSQNFENQSSAANFQARKFLTNFKIRKLSSNNDSSDNSTSSFSKNSSKNSKIISESATDSDSTVKVDNDENCAKKSARIASKSKEKAKSSKFDVLKMKRIQKTKPTSSNEVENDSSTDKNTSMLPKMSKKVQNETSKRLSSEEILERYNMYRQQKSTESVSSKEFENDLYLDKIYKKL